MNDTVKKSRKAFDAGIENATVLVQAAVYTASPTYEPEVRGLADQALGALGVARKAVVAVLDFDPLVESDDSPRLRQLDLPGTTPGAAVLVVPPVPSAVLWGGPVAVSGSEGVRGEQWSRVAWVCHGRHDDPPSVSDVFFVPDPQSPDGREGTWYTWAPDLVDARDTYPLGRAELTLAAPEGNGEARLVLTGWHDARRIVLGPRDALATISTAPTPAPVLTVEQVIDLVGQLGGRHSPNLATPPAPPPHTAADLVESWAASPGRSLGELALAGKFLGHPCPPMVTESTTRCPWGESCGSSQICRTHCGPWAPGSHLGQPPASPPSVGYLALIEAAAPRGILTVEAGTEHGTEVFDLVGLAVDQTYTRPAWLGLASPEQLEALNAERVLLLLARWEALRPELEAAGIEVGARVDQHRVWRDSQGHHRLVVTADGGCAIATCTPAGLELVVDEHIYPNSREAQSALDKHAYEGAWQEVLPESTSLAGKSKAAKRRGK